VEQYALVRLHAREGQESAVEEALRHPRLFYIHSRWVDEAAL